MDGEDDRKSSMLAIAPKLMKLTSGGDRWATYQFRHLSLQESLCVQQLVDAADSIDSAPQWASDGSMVHFLAVPFNRDACRIAAGALGRGVAKQRDMWMLGGLDDRAVTPVCALLTDNDAVRKLGLVGVRMNLQAASMLARQLSQSSHPSARGLVKLDLAECSFTSVESCMLLARVLRG
jgi:hypothetical protein